MSPQTWWNEIIVLSAIGRKPTIVPVRGNITRAVSAPWPVAQLDTGWSAAIAGAEAEHELVRRDRGCAGFRRAIDRLSLARANFGKAFDQEVEIAVRDGHERAGASSGREAVTASSAISIRSCSLAASSAASI